MQLTSDFRFYSGRFGFLGFSKKISFADSEGSIMGKKNGPFDYAYNGQISVDADYQIIVGQQSVSIRTINRRSYRPCKPYKR